MVQYHVYKYTVVRGDINYGVVACIQLYSGERRHTLWCSNILHTYSGEGDIHYGVVACI